MMFDGFLHSDFHNQCRWCIFVFTTLSIVFHNMFYPFSIFLCVFWFFTKLSANLLWNQKRNLLWIFDFVLVHCAPYKLSRILLTGCVKAGWFMQTPDYFWGPRPLICLCWQNPCWPWPADCTSQEQVELTIVAPTLLQAWQSGAGSIHPTMQHYPLDTGTYA